MTPFYFPKANLILLQHHLKIQRTDEYKYKMNSLIFSLYKHMIFDHFQWSIDLWLNMFLSAIYVLHILEIGDRLQLLYLVYSLSGSILKPRSYAHLCKTAFPIPISLHFSNEEKEGKKRD